jgi:maleylpyruvate isomerase
MKPLAFTFFGYWRSSCTWRVRIALRLKGLNDEFLPVDLRLGEQYTSKNPNPMSQVPSWSFQDGMVLTQSLAMLQLLEDIHPEPSILPSDPIQKARAWQFAEMINSGIQPLQNYSLLQELGANGIDGRGWAKRQIEVGLKAMESHCTGSSGHFLVGETPTIADCCLIPQLYNARRFDCQLEKFPTLLQIEKNCMERHAFTLTYPTQQILEAS